MHALTFVCMFNSCCIIVRHVQAVPLSTRIKRTAIHNTCVIIRKLSDTELENILLRDPHSQANRLRRLNLSGTVGTSGHFNNTATSLLPCVKIISYGDIVAPTSNFFLGEE